MKPNPVGWFEIYVSDMDRAKKFYETVFDTKLSRLENPEIDMWAFPMGKDESGASGTLAKMKGMSSGGSSTLVYFTSEDCAKEEARVVKAGGKIQRPKTSIGEYGFISIATDTEGNMIGIHSQG